LSPRLEVVERKLLALAGYLEELRPKARLGLAAYLKSGTTRRAVERLLQLCVEAAADACAGLLSGAGRGGAPSTRATFAAAATIGAVEQTLARRLGDAAGLRNRLVHDYDHLDDALVWAAARSALRDFPEFIAGVTTFLDRNPEN